MKKVYYSFVVLFLTIFSLIIMIYYSSKLIGPEVYNIPIYFFAKHSLLLIIMNIISIILILFLGIYFVYLFKINIEIQKQELSEKDSWLRYLYGTLIVLTFTLLMWFLFSKEIFLVYSIITEFSILLILYFIEKSKVKKYAIDYRFPYKSISKDKDEYGYAKVAEQLGKELLTQNNDVFVFGINGKYGEGKSSFARMLIESLKQNADSKEQDSFLYMYISLTETNESEDFSKLFKERWIESISSKYPIININKVLPIMHDILRNSEMTNFESIFSVLTLFNVGLKKTTNWKSDVNNPIYISENNAKMFLHIPAFNERFMIIIIDELERGKINEIFRVIELLERLKNMTQGGFPVKLLVGIVFDYEALKVYIEHQNDKENSNEAFLIKEYFIDGLTKNINIIKYLPYIGKENKYDNILRTLVNHKYNEDQTKNNDDISDEQKQFIYSVFASKSLREIDNILSDVKMFYDTYKNDFLYNYNIVELTAIKILEKNYPEILNLLINSVKLPELIIKRVSANNEEKINGDFEFVFEYFHTYIKDNKKWLNIENEKAELRIILEFVAKYLFEGYDELNKNSMIPLHSFNFVSNNEPVVLHSYLALTEKIPIAMKDEFIQKSIMDGSNEDTIIKELKELSDETLMRLFRKNQKNKEKGKEILIENEIKTRIKKYKKQKDIFKYGSLNEQQDLFLYYIKSTKNHVKNELIEDILKDDNIPVSTKILYFFNLTSNLSYEEILSDSQKKYFDIYVKTNNFIELTISNLENKENIFETEEFNTDFLYNLWDGNYENKELIEKIRRIAKQNITLNENTLKFYIRYYYSTVVDFINLNNVEDGSILISKIKKSYIMIPWNEIIGMKKKNNSSKVLMEEERKLNSKESYEKFIRKIESIKYDTEPLGYKVKLLEQIIKNEFQLGWDSNNPKDLIDNFNKVLEKTKTLRLNENDIYELILTIYNRFFNKLPLDLQSGISPSIDSRISQYRSENMPLNDSVDKIKDEVNEFMKNRLSTE